MIKKNKKLKKSHDTTDQTEFRSSAGFACHSFFQFTPLT